LLAFSTACLAADRTRIVAFAREPLLRVKRFARRLRVLRSPHTAPRDHRDDVTLVFERSKADVVTHLSCGSLSLMDVEEQHRIVDLLEAAITADGDIADEERAFLRRVMERFGLSEDERANRQVTSSAGRTTAILRTFPPQAQAGIIALLVDAVVADGRVEPQERALLLAAAAAIGIEAGALEERIALRLRSIAPKG
jgi:uncharacterized tellurite resistance protein B-like protein